MQTFGRFFGDFEQGAPDFYQQIFEAIPNVQSESSNKAFLYSIVGQHPELKEGALDAIEQLMREESGSSSTSGYYGHLLALKSDYFTRDQILEHIIEDQSANGIRYGILNNLYRLNDEDYDYITRFQLERIPVSILSKDKLINVLSATPRLLPILREYQSSLSDQMAIKAIEEYISYHSFMFSEDAP